MIANEIIQPQCRLKCWLCGDTQIRGLKMIPARIDELRTKIGLPTCEACIERIRQQSDPGRFQGAGI